MLMVVLFLTRSAADTTGLLFLLQGRILPFELLLNKLSLFPETSISFREVSVVLKY